MLAATLGATVEADERFRAAADLDRSIGARTWLAHTVFEHGRLLLTQRDGGRAAPLLAEADALAGEIGMHALLAKVRALTASQLTPSPLPDDLSAREAQVLALVARGLSNREIGAELHISEHTAANHIRSILRKTRCANRTEAAAYAIRRGLAQDAGEG
jgi:DNA-binding CsgD family transcriptional regulator